MTTVFSSVPIGEPDRIIQLAIGQQPGIGGDRGTAKLQQQTTVEIEPQRFAGRFTHRVRHRQPDWLLGTDPIPQPPQTRSKSPIHPGNAGLCASEPDQASGRRYVFAAVHESGTGPSRHSAARQNLVAIGGLCCKSRKLQGHEFFAKTRNGKQSPIRKTQSRCRSRL